MSSCAGNYLHGLAAQQTVPSHRARDPVGGRRRLLRWRPHSHLVCFPSLCSPCCCCSWCCSQLACQLSSQLLGTLLFAVAAVCAGAAAPLGAAAAAGLPGGHAAGVRLHAASEVDMCAGLCSCSSCWAAGRACRIAAAAGARLSCCSRTTAILSSNNLRVACGRPAFMRPARSDCPAAMAGRR